MYATLFPCSMDVQYVLLQWSMCHIRAKIRVSPLIRSLHMDVLNGHDARRVHPRGRADFILIVLKVSQNRLADFPRGSQRCIGSDQICCKSRSINIMWWVQWAYSDHTTAVERLILQESCVAWHECITDLQTFTYFHVAPDIHECSVPHYSHFMLSDSDPLVRNSDKAAILQKRCSISRTLWTSCWLGNNKYFY